MKVQVQQGCWVWSPDSLSKPARPLPFSSPHKARWSRSWSQFCADQTGNMCKCSINVRWTYRWRAHQNPVKTLWMCPLLFGCWKQSLPSSKKAGFSQLLRCIIDLCQDIPSSRLPPWLTPPAATRDEEFHAACLFHGAIFHRLIISLEGCNFISVTPERTFDERRFVDAKTVMMAFITAGAAAVDTNRIFFSADWKMSHPPSFHSDLGKSRSVRAGIFQPSSIIKRRK